LRRSRTLDCNPGDIRLKSSSASLNAIEADMAAGHRAWCGAWGIVPLLDRLTRALPSQRKGPRFDLDQNSFRCLRETVHSITSTWRRPVKKIIIVAAALLCGTFLSFDWSQERGLFLSLSSDTAQARVGRPASPRSVAGVARRTGRRCAAGVYHC
jgi:hypothetical protein